MAAVPLSLGRTGVVDTCGLQLLDAVSGLGDYPFGLWGVFSV